MTRRRWIADEVSANRAALTGEHAGHLIRTLRARVGQEFDVVANGVVHRGRITSIAENRVEFELAQEIKTTAIANLALLLAIIKFDRMEWAIEKCTELGVGRIIPLIARRTDAHLASAAGNRVQRWRRIALQAAEQSHRTTPPEISAPTKLRQAANLPGTLRIVLAETEGQTSLRDVLATSDSKDEIVLAVGPEGGWSVDELQTFLQSGWKAASLGPTILRAETAAIAAVALTMSEFSP